MLKHLKLPFSRLIGLNVNRTGHIEKLVSALGGLCGILAVSLVARDYLGNEGAAWIVASMGASAVLLFAVPHGPLSQPWPVLGGHLAAAAIGVTCARYIPDVILASAIAVALTIAAMHYLRCIHPPGGATALTAVIGGERIHALGYTYLITPVLIDVLIILAVAVIFNFAFPWRRYPSALAKYLSAKGAGDLPISESGGDEPSITRESLASAIMSLDKTIDISEEDLQKIYALALHDSQSRCLRPENIIVGRYYSNGHHDTRWQIRQVVDMPGAEHDTDLLIYKIVAGHGRRSSGTATRGEFARWARHEVFLNENSWQRVPPVPKSTPSV
jgi:CBS domain-containing membrane protein